MGDWELPPQSGYPYFQSGGAKPKTLKCVCFPYISKANSIKEESYSN